MAFSFRWEKIKPALPGEIGVARLFFGLFPESEVFSVGSKLLLHGLFVVEKHEEEQGIPFYRLFMNLVPLNDLCQGMAGDMQTLAQWLGRSPFHIEPHETLMVSSEDLQCLTFFPLSLPPCGYPFLCFNNLKVFVKMRSCTATHRV